MEPLVYVLAFAAVALPVLRFLPLIFFTIQHEAFTAQIVKLLEARNYERALKLCRVVPKTFYGAMIKAVLEAGQTCKPSDGQTLIKETLRDAFQREYKVQMRRATRLGFLAPLGVVLAAAGLFVAGNEPAEPPVVYGPAVITVMLWIASMRKVQKIRDRSMQGLERILPAATGCIAESAE